MFDPLHSSAARFESMLLIDHDGFFVLLLSSSLLVQQSSEVQAARVGANLIPNDMIPLYLETESFMFVRPALSCFATSVVLMSLGENNRWVTHANFNATMHKYVATDTIMTL